MLKLPGLSSKLKSCLPCSISAQVPSLPDAGVFPAHSHSPSTKVLGKMVVSRMAARMRELEIFLKRSPVGSAQLLDWPPHRTHKAVSLARSLAGSLIMCICLPVWPRFELAARCELYPLRPPLYLPFNLAGWLEKPPCMGGRPGFFPSLPRRALTHTERARDSFYLVRRLTRKG